MRGGVRAGRERRTPKHSPSGPGAGPGAQFRAQLGCQGGPKSNFSGKNPEKLEKVSSGSRSGKSMEIWMKNVRKMGGLEGENDNIPLAFMQIMRNRLVWKKHENESPKVIKNDVQIGTLGLRG